MTSVLQFSKQRGWAAVCMRVSVCVRAALALSRRGCRPGFTGMQHLASCEPEPDARWPDVGQAPLGGGCTGGSHNLIVRPNPEHITLEYVHHQRYRHKKKKKGLNKERRRKSKASRVPAASDTLSGGGDKCGESLDCTYPWAPAVQELGRSGGLSQEVYLPPCGESY